MCGSLLTEFHQNRTINVFSAHGNVFTLKLRPAVQLSVKNRTKFHENPADGLFVDSHRQAEGCVFPTRCFFFCLVKDF